MTTIKSYSSIEQSRKLAEILPTETADMWWTALNWQETEYYVEVKQDGINQPKKAVPCWSLAALLGVLPRSIEFKGDKYYLRFMKEYVEYANDEVSITGRCLRTIGNDNLVDACYEMILELHELKML